MQQVTLDNQFLHEKFNYNVKHIKDLNDIKFMKMVSAFSRPNYFAYDTETTGLNIILDKPFLVIFGFSKEVFYWSADFKEATIAMFDIVKEHKRMLFAHNAKFDFHMLYNIGTPIPEGIELSDSVTVARLISTADDEYASMRLEKIGERYVDKSAKFAGREIKLLLEGMRKERKKVVLNNYKMVTGISRTTDVWENYMKRVKFITKYNPILDDYKEPTYYDVFLENPDLVYKYAADDVIIILEFLNNINHLYVSKYSRNGILDMQVWLRENKLIRPIALTERNGFRVDVEYLIKSHYKVEKYRDLLYEKLRTLTRNNFSNTRLTDWNVGQHKTIKEFFLEKYGIELEKCDKQAINKLARSADPEISEIAKLIKKLRTVTKWLSTYIDGVLNRLILHDDGFYYLHTTINNNGTVSGRVSCDLQQMPKYSISEEDDESHEMLLDNSLSDDDDHELFHPRKYIVPKEGYYLYFSDKELSL